MTLHPRLWQALLAALESARRQGSLLTYRTLIEQLQLPPPAMQRLAAALEQLAQQDAGAQRPLRSALVISQTGSRLPRPGFFLCAAGLGCFAGAPEGPAAAAWHAAEVQRVFGFDYPEDTQ